MGKENGTQERPYRSTSILSRSEVQRILLNELHTIRVSASGCKQGPGLDYKKLHRMRVN